MDEGAVGVMTSALQRQGMKVKVNGVVHGGVHVDDK